MHNSQARGEDLDKTEEKGVKTHSWGGKIRERTGPSESSRWSIWGEELEGVQGVQAVVQHEPSV